jgi:hypothetical protein
MLEPHPLRVQEDEMSNRVSSFIFTAGDLKNRKHIRVFMSCVITLRSHNSRVSLFNVIINMRTAGGRTVNILLHVCLMTNGGVSKHLLLSPSLPLGNFTQ